MLEMPFFQNTAAIRNLKVSLASSERCDFVGIADCGFYLHAIRANRGVDADYIAASGQPQRVRVTATQTMTAPPSDIEKVWTPYSVLRRCRSEPSGGTYIKRHY
jgi:hypothetical protein